MTPSTGHALVLRASADGAVIDVEVLASRAGVHPELVRRLALSGLLEPVAGAPAAPLFRRDSAARLARALRLRRDLGLNYAGALLACDLLARIDDLEGRLARYENPRR